MESINLTGKKQIGNMGKRGLDPAQSLTLGVIGFILLGSLLLSLPFATADGKGAPFLTALFTATSAVCVNGLVVVDTGTYYTMLGQLIILILIQVGGLGFMTFATLFAMIMGRRITLKERIMLQETLNQISMEGIVRLVKYVIQITFAIEAAGAVILAIRWFRELGWGRAIYYGIFHSIAAFNNAGFDLFGDFQSLTTFVDDLTVNMVIAALMVFGGLGFYVLSEIYVKRGKKLHLHSLIVLKTSFWLIIIGTVIIFILEFTNLKTLAGLNPLGKVLASFFQAVSPRSGGYNTLAIGDLRDTTLLVLVLLMFIGASPGSTGGGIKTTTFTAILMAIIANFKGKTTVSIMERTLPQDLVQKAMTLTFAALALVLLLTGVLSLTENHNFLQILFEVTSAFGTTGWSTGITPDLTPFGKLAIIGAMFVGRVGPLTLVYALTKSNAAQQPAIKYPEERIVIG